jgi:hypothetical protein
MIALTAEHAHLPMRKLPGVGIGAGLLCPILLGLRVLYVWIVLTIGSRWTATLTVVYGLLFAAFFIGEAREIAGGSAAAPLIKGSLPPALLLSCSCGSYCSRRRCHVRGPRSQLIKL